jgi:hypothetical protein
VTTRPAGAGVTASSCRPSCPPPSCGRARRSTTGPRRRRPPATAAGATGTALPAAPRRRPRRQPRRRWPGAGRAPAGCRRALAGSAAGNGRDEAGGGSRGALGELGQPDPPLDGPSGSAASDGATVRTARPRASGTATGQPPGSPSASHHSSSPLSVRPAGSTPGRREGWRQGALRGRRAPLGVPGERAVRVAHLVEEVAGPWGSERGVHEQEVFEPDQAVGVDEAAVVGSTR